MKAAIISCAAIGIVTVLATLFVEGAKTSDLAGDADGERHGRQLMTELVPHRLACSSCHIDAGAEPGELTLVNAVARYPGDRIRQRINECVTRNMNSRPLDAYGAEMTAIIAWLHFLADENAVMKTSRRETNPLAFVQSGHTPNAGAGERVFEKRCADCHGKDGAGLSASRDPARGYLFPPLWGPESFPNASEMNQLSTLARYIQAKMPLGQADLNETEAWSVAAFLTSMPRPHIAK